MENLLIVYRDGPKNGQCERMTARPEGAAVHAEGGWYRLERPATHAETNLGGAMKLNSAGD